jgi:hypothetical protein
LRRAFPILLAAAAALAPPSPARAADPPPGTPARPGGAPADDAAERQAEAALDAELDAEEPAPSIALGPARKGRPVVSLEAGWLRSGLRLDLGLVGELDLVARVEAMLLYDGFGGQNGVAAGLRWTPLVWPRARVSGEVTAGQLYAATDAASGTVTTLRAEVAGGFLLGPALAYARGSVRGLRITPLTGSSFTSEQELGVGVEAHRGRLVAGAEGFVLARPRLDALWQWRVRLGFAI